MRDRKTVMCLTLHRDRRTAGISRAVFLVTRKKTDVKTAQRSLRHAENTTMLDHYAQTDMDELIAAQELVLNAISSQAGPVN